MIIEVQNNFEQWSITEGLGPESGGMYDRPAKGIFNNLQSYAFGGKALDSNDDRDRLPEIILFNSGGKMKPGNKLFHRRFVSDLNYSVQISKDLKNWNSIWSTSDGKSSPFIVNLQKGEIFNEITISDPGEGRKKSHQFLRVVTDYKSTE